MSETSTKPTVAEWIAAGQELASAAPLGPWLRWRDLESAPGWDGFIVVGDDTPMDQDEGLVARCYEEEGAAFIAHARTALPQALDALAAVLELHGPLWDDGSGAPCDHDGETYPCATVRAVTDALGGPR